MSVIDKAIDDCCTHLNVVLPELAAKTIDDYLQLLTKWNKAYNLTAIKNYDDMLVMHVFDSLTLLPHLPKEPFSILDVGSGAGIPGVLLAIARPDIQVTCLDSNGKKTRFLQHAKRELNLTNLTIIHDRVESVPSSQQYCYIVSRAFASLEKFYNLTKHLLAENGQLLAMKGKYPEDELQEIAEVVKLEEVIRLAVPGLDADRHLVKLSNK